VSDPGIKGGGGKGLNRPVKKKKLGKKSSLKWQERGKGACGQAGKKKQHSLEMTRGGGGGKRWLRGEVCHRRL